MACDLHDVSLHTASQEADKFSKAFKDPEFVKLFEEYAKEVSDPKVCECMHKFAMPQGCAYYALIWLN